MNGLVAKIAAGQGWPVLGVCFTPDQHYHLHSRSTAISYRHVKPAHIHPAPSFCSLAGPADKVTCSRSSRKRLSTQSDAAAAAATNLLAYIGPSRGMVLELRVPASICNLLAEKCKDQALASYATKTSLGIFFLLDDPCLRTLHVASHLTKIQHPLLSWPVAFSALGWVASCAQSR